ncbi:MAG TPA: Xaa-Pro peptidase family protein [Syntrophorhabdaceae bacterium]|mgnify:FL=1|nr:aminopeptidase P family protein [Syntrophorhabdaceae bacterium]MDI9562482.1 Xaa-Pro peptidase family protein [Pseudomonadota bacterium]OQC47899.1 MAG: putative peptidase [Deltaproteobacteria bacterium ADurb.Bin026]HOS59238.1 Xaa-Pro peptidase family protein [Syntrophorhabdaceae bacterium]HPN97367.1 Xaa-Pro peptidase family protein [Syntrophorhabdaceae bacterium]
MNKKTFQNRIERCTSIMKAEGYNILLLIKPSNMYYLTGDGRLCAYAMVTHDGKVAIGVPKTDIDDVKRSAYFDSVVGFEDEVGMIHSIAHYFEHFDIKKGTVGLEYSFLTQSMMGIVTHPHAKPRDVLPKDCTHIMSGLRVVKENQEIDRLRQSALVADIGIKAAIEAVKPGTSESRIAAEAEYAMRYAGAEGFWRTYVSSGSRTGIAHGLPTNRKLESGDLVMIDVHPVVDGYSSDVCRTVCVGKPSIEQQSAYDVYLKAQQATVAKARAGVGMVELGETMHGIMKNEGHGEHIFGPPIHGIGIDFEESPLPPGHAFFHGEKEPPPLPANVVIAIGNCGLYSESWGVRVEDTVVVGDEGPIILTTYPYFLNLT